MAYSIHAYLYTQMTPTPKSKCTIHSFLVFVTHSFFLLLLLYHLPPPVLLCYLVQSISGTGGEVSRDTLGPWTHSGEHSNGIDNSNNLHSLQLQGSVRPTFEAMRWIMKLHIIIICNPCSLVPLNGIALPLPSCLPTH